MTFPRITCRELVSDEYFFLRGRHPMPPGRSKRRSLMHKRILPVVALGAVATLGLAACAGGGADTGGAVDGEGQELTVWIMKGTNPDASAFYDEVSSAFEDETGATVKIEEIQWADAHDRFVTSIAGGTTPDIAETGTTWTAEFADAGAL